MQIRIDRFKRGNVLRTLAGLGREENFIPVDLIVRGNTNTKIIGWKCIGQIHHHRFIFPGRQAQKIINRNPTAFSVRNL